MGRFYGSFTFQARHSPAQDFFVPNFRRGHSFAMILRYDGEDKVTRRIKEARFAIYLDGISQGRRGNGRKMDGQYRAEKYGL